VTILTSILLNTPSNMLVYISMHTQVAGKNLKFFNSKRPRSSHKDSLRRKTDSPSRTVLSLSILHDVVVSSETGKFVRTYESLAPLTGLL
jgi:hypothetical protein